MSRLILGVALDGRGVHPAAPGEPPTVEEFIRLVRRSEAALLDFVTLEDGPGRLDSALLLTVAARETARIGLVPLGPALGQPAAYAARFATLDLLSGGRAGVRPRIAADDIEHERILAILGTPEGDRRVAELFDRAAEFLRRVGLEWDKAEPSSAAPQGRPPFISLAHDTVPYRFAARRSDVVIVTPADAGELRATRAEVDRLAAEEGRTLKVLADLNVILAPSDGAAAERLADLEDAAGGPFESDAGIFHGTPEGLAGLIEEWHHEGGADGFRIRPAVLPLDLNALVDRTVPELIRRGLFRSAYETRTLRGHLGLAAVTPEGTS
ncbi:LLM class flavin-dependent oxidoreductase [Streptomyces sp. NPDC058371]|uniref:LLM class flavin-dependent oxidoreductase n=1 Tax=Streptomyces sp. NPDC058371 TaxID=3346463 RepID=UPI00364F27E6